MVTGNLNVTLMESFLGTVILVHHRHLTYEETEAEKKVALPRSHSGSREGRN